MSKNKKGTNIITDKKVVKYKSDPGYQQKVWANSGIHMVNRSFMINCKKCGLNTTHGSKQHDEWVANPSTFKPLSNHMYEHEKTLMDILTMPTILPVLIRLPSPCFSSLGKTKASFPFHMLNMR